MFQKKDYVYVDNIGVCKVEEITNLVQKDGNSVMYYGLRSQQHTQTTAYYPIENHEVIIRNLIGLDEAEAIIKDYNQEEPNVSEPELYEAHFVIELDKRKNKK